MKQKLLKIDQGDQYAFITIALVVLSFLAFIIISNQNDIPDQKSKTPYITNAVMPGVS